MNTYEKQFIAKCPNNGEMILYQFRLEVKNRMVMVEHINTACALHKTGYHEDIANALFERFGGVQTLKARHDGVDITTERS